MRTTTLLTTAAVLLALLVTTQGCSVRYRCGTTTTSYMTRCGRWGWSKCRRQRTQPKICTKPCPVDARMLPWSNWRSVGSCSKPCGTGSRKYVRTRTCIPPRYGGKSCGPLTAYTTKKCNTHHCPVDAKMLPWFAWRSISSCSRVCGTGYMKYIRTRTCIPPRYGGRACGSIVEFESRKCNTHNCPVNAVMSAWSTWQKTDECTKPCGTGQITFQRTRTCEPPKYGGKQCGTLLETEIRKCNTHHCPVNAVMSAWSTWQKTDECTKPCGTGQITFQRTRTCEPPKYGGKPCGTLLETEIRKCNTHHCPVNAVMSAWSTWQKTDECTKLCGTGQITFQRTRTCEPPKYGGKPCGTLLETEIRKCNTHHCPVDGRWSEFSEWSSFSECSVSCGGGYQSRTRTRKCSAPKPQYGGADCEGEAMEGDERGCNTHPCPIDGQWTQWEDWSPVDNCPVLCGGGQTKLTRSRACADPAPMYGGEECNGENTEIQDQGPCNTEPCGDLCPEGERKFHPHAQDDHLYYKCDDHQVARLRTCPDLGTWNQAAERCAPMTCDMKSGLNKAHPTDCTKYINCLMGNRVVERKCPPGHAWNEENKRCEEAVNGDCFY